MSDKKIDSLKHKKATRARIPSKEEAGFESTECGLDNVFTSTLFEEVIDGLDSCFSKPQLEALVLTVVDDLLTFGRRGATGFGTG